MAHCIVIGSGIAGLAAAIRLQAKGHQVIVFEANSYPGGKLTAFKQGDYRFDAGPSLFTLPHLIDALFECCGESANQSFQYKKVDQNCHYFYPDTTHFISPSNSLEMSEKLQDVFDENPKAVQSFFKKSAKLFEITSPIFLENSLHQVKTYLSFNGLKGILNLWRLNPFKSMHRANLQTFKDPRTVQLFDRFATYNGSDPYHAPATLNIIPHLEFAYGTFFPLKGMHDITESLYQLALRQGVEFHFKTKVDKILLEKNKAVGVLVNQKEYKADVILSNMDVYPTYKHLLPQVQMPEKVKAAEPSSSALIFYWGIKHSFPALGLHNVFFAENYKQEFDCIFNKQELSDDLTVYINISSKEKKDDAPDACENWFVMINAPSNKGQDWDTLIPKARKQILAKLSKALETDIEPLIENESILDPRSIELKTSSHQGALYGSSSNHLMSAFFRHANFSSKIKNLYFCGGSVHPGGGIPLCLMGAKIVATMIDKKYKKN